MSGRGGGVEDGDGPDGGGGLVRAAVGADAAVAEVEAAEHGDAQVAETVLEHVEEVPAPVGVVVEPVEQTERDARDAVERAGADEVGQLAVDLAEADGARGLEEQHGAVQVADGRHRSSRPRR